jgi:hypothetical protein
MMSETTTKRSGRRYRPYTVIGIRRLKCIRLSCPNPAVRTFQVCADSRTYRPACEECCQEMHRLIADLLGGSPFVYPHPGPTTEEEIDQLPCSCPDCGSSGYSRWDIHDRECFIVCWKHDILINKTILRFMDDPDADAKMARYCARIERELCHL